MKHYSSENHTFADHENQIQSDAFWIQEAKASNNISSKGLVQKLRLHKKKTTNIMTGVVGINGKAKTVVL